MRRNHGSSLARAPLPCVVQDREERGLEGLLGGNVSEGNVSERTLVEVWRLVRVGGLVRFEKKWPTTHGCCLQV